MLIHTYPKDFVSNRNISNILEEAPPLRNKLEFVRQFASAGERNSEPRLLAGR